MNTPDVDVEETCFGDETYTVSINICYSKEEAEVVAEQVQRILNYNAPTVKAKYGEPKVFK